MYDCKDAGGRAKQEAKAEALMIRLKRLLLVYGTRMTAMEGGNVENAGRIFSAMTCHPWRFIVCVLLHKRYTLRPCK